MRYEFHPEARLEYLDAITHYEERQPGLGARLTIEVEAAIQRILEAPNAWRVIEDDVRRYLTRKFPFGPLYCIEEDSILILAVMRCSRRPGYWRDRVPKSAG